ncbi:S-layer homology domain-containing protein [Paenibacillus ginsengarvi]|uniref:S-layer homology domain-containing protein n=1 Tax=Paenibacillus ginsengarvi TaxID=400777 RepID=A0A3B0CSV6_9BACL|nr:S-layer homology domain-containing protein [Paenibacillus ginsengarvi]RKN86920.1 S-layer homology domain-containing protein [Paenibacillus ginsengarvi]
MNRVTAIVLALVIALGLQPIQRAAAEAAVESGRFSDTKGHWAEPTINRLVDQGILDGYPDGTFRPDEPVSADQFLKILLLSFTEKHPNGERSWKSSFLNSLSLSNQNLLRQDYRGFSFAPSTIGYWAKPYIDLAADLHLIEPSEIPDFKQKLNREQVAELLYYTLKETEYLEDADYSRKLASSIGDLRSASDRQMKFVAESFAKGIMEGYPNGYFGIGVAVTRAESLTIAERLTDKNKRIATAASAAGQYAVVVPTKDGGYKRLLFPNELMKTAYTVMENAGKLRGTNYDLTETTLRLFKDADTKAKALSLTNGTSEAHNEASLWLEPKYNTYGITLRVEDGALARNREPIKLFVNHIFGYEAAKFDAWFEAMYGKAEKTKPFEEQFATIGNYTVEASSPDNMALVFSIVPKAN